MEKKKYKRNSSLAGFGDRGTFGKQCEGRVRAESCLELTACKEMEPPDLQPQNFIQAAA